MQMACVGSGVELSTGAVRRGIGGHREPFAEALGDTDNGTYSWCRVP